MDNELLRKVQLAELEILQDVSKVCEDNNIPYFLNEGTLLGAIRHKGFIPWDDDIDIGMLRDDFQRFLNIAPEKLREKYYLQTWDNDPQFPFAIAKVRKLGTIFKEVSSTDNEHCELFIDIFPFDVFPESIKDQKKQGRTIDWCRKTLMIKNGVKPWRISSNPLIRLGVWIKYLPYTFCSLIYDRKKIKEKYNKTTKRFNNQNTGYVFESCCGTNYGKFVFPTQCLNKTSLVEFEGFRFRAPADPDMYLRIGYGDYMKLPPENKRVNHAVVEVKL